MSPVPEEAAPTESEQRAAPRASDWLWRPLRVKLLWAFAAIFWLGLFVGSIAVPHAVFEPYDGILMFLGVVLHPFLILPLVGLGFLRAWIDHQFSISDAAPDGEAGFDRMHMDLNARRWRDPTHPLNVRHLGNPINPSSEAWRNEHYFGRN
jgi:hypothetical protein